MGENKCHQIHIGKKSSVCPDLKVHESKMAKVVADPYLGDVLSEDCSNKRNIESKCNKGMGLISSIMTILTEVCLGSYYFETAVLLRESIFINGILTNLEVCYNLTKDNINCLENLDKVLLKKIFQSHSKVPSEALFLESGCYSVKFYIISRRLNFLHYILNRPEKDLLRNFFEIQSKYPAKNDWCLTVREDLAYFNINLSFEDIKIMSKDSFSKLVKAKTKETAFKELMATKYQHSKMQHLSYKELKMQSYLCSKVYPDVAKAIFRYRTSTSNCKANFPSMFRQTNPDGVQDMNCPECLIHDDTQLHLLDHAEIPQNTSTQEIYMKLFSDSASDNLEVASLLESVMKRRNSNK